MTDAVSPLDTLQNLNEDQFQPIDPVALFDAPRATHPPRILMLYGSLRERSYSRLATEEAARILRKLGAEVRIFNPDRIAASGLDFGRPSEGEGASGAVAVVRGAGLVLAGASRFHDRHHEGPD